MAWLQLIRWKNLLIIFATQLLAWRCVITPQISGLNNNMALFSNTLNFLCISFSTILIAAGGYIINDYFDVKIDTVNHPEKVVLGKAIARKSAIVSHILLNIIALGLAACAASHARHYEWLLLQASCVVLLWFYSTHFKRQYMAGNLVVSTLTALTIVILIVYNPGIYQAHSPVSGTGKELPFFPVWTLLVYAYFAFMLTWIREIVKDMEDYKGDEAEGCVTMPLKRGLKYAMGFTKILSVMVIVPLIAACYMLITARCYLLSGYILLLLIIPIAAWALYPEKQLTSQYYHNRSRGLKFIMVTGVFSLVIYYFQLFLINATA